MAAPAFWGLLNSFIGSNPAAPQQQALFDIVYRNQASTTLQSFQLSELRQGAQPTTYTPDLYAVVSSGSPFIWPAHGNITSYMDYTHPMGIDIGLDGGVDSPILAVARGTVSFTGGSPSEGYGYYVKVDHGDGLVTLYAHLSEIFVSTGQEVGQGDVLGYGGSTGKSTGKHLHFEVRYGGYLANPLSLLPPMGAGTETVPFDCQTEALALQRGSTANLEFAGSIPDGVRIVEAYIDGIETGRPRPIAHLVSNTAASVEALPGLDVTGAGIPDRFSLKLVLEGVTRFEKACELEVTAMSSSFTPYSEASHVASTNGSPFEDPEHYYEEEHYEEVEPTEEPELPAETPTEEPLPEETETPIAVPTDIPILGELPTETPEPTETTVPTETVTPTEEPTETVVSPTETPVPTETASAEPTTATETSTPSSDD